MRQSAVPLLNKFLDSFLKSRYFRRVPILLDQVVADAAQQFIGVDLWRAPPEMVILPPDKDGKATWIPVDSPVNEERVKGFERYLEKPLPPLFREYLKFKCLLYVDLYIGSLPDIDPRHPFQWIEWSDQVRSHQYYKDNRNLIPFSYGPSHNSVLCFDTNRKIANDYTIVIIFTDAISSSDPIIYESADVFNTFEDYINFLVDWLAYCNETENTERQDFDKWLIDHGRNPPGNYYYKNS